MASEKTLERRAAKEAAIKDFERNQKQYEEECFDTYSIFYFKMMEILESAKDRPLVPEAGYELHHRIPRSFFKKKFLEVVDENNLYKLTYAQHFLVHYYAYMCATKLMKSAMSLALLEMKKVCTKVDGCTEENAIEMSRLFDKVKNELYTGMKADCKDQSIKFWRKKFGKTRLFVTDVFRKEKTIEFMCEDCGAKFVRSPDTWKGKTCPYCSNAIGFQEDIDILWFAIDLRTDKAVWFTSSLEKPSNPKQNRIIFDVKGLQKNFPRNGKYRYLYRPRIVGVNLKGYDWGLPEAKKYI